MLAHVCGVVGVGGGGGGGGRYVSRKQQTIKIYIFCKLKKKMLRARRKSCLYSYVINKELKGL